eukprot:TRINITY_DN17498_c0_g1_i2.p1 TRINITY_DN17498_c0_g1~~TRINITY_DN17498_c0_g1_i2.p1  ORF type:complete len:177 (-),score=3.78 TRINITY_DN17498_c0_g1_i2:59-532(-)
MTCTEWQRRANDECAEAALPVYRIVCQFVGKPLLRPRRMIGSVTACHRQVLLFLCAEILGYFGKKSMFLEHGMESKCFAQMLLFRQIAQRFQMYIVACFVSLLNCRIQCVQDRELRILSPSYSVHVDPQQMALLCFGKSLMFCSPILPPGFSDALCN